MLPENVQESVRIAQEMTQNNNKYALSGPFLNLQVPMRVSFKVYPKPLYALHVQGRDSYCGTICRAGKGRPGRYRPPVRAKSVRHYSLAFTIGCARITEEDIERYMMTTLGGSPPLDILVRSSGVKRLSDFLMWQVRFTTRRADRSRCSRVVFLCRHRRTCSCILLLRIGQMLDFGTFSPLFWLIRPRCGVSRQQHWRAE